MSRKGKPIETESRLVFAWGWELEGLTANGQKGFSRVMEIF